MSFPNPSTALAHTIVDELIRNGVDFAVAAPGSRSTALILELTRRPEIRLLVNLDERSAAFRALGNSVSTGSPSVVLTTSGSAVANLAPAIAEAERAGVPLIALTADRPQDAIERRSNQTMDHFALFAGLTRARVQLGPATIARDGNERWRHEVALAVHATKGGVLPPGPVHINVAFEEPTVPVSDDGRVASADYPFGCAGAPRGQPWTGHDGHEEGAAPLNLPSGSSRVLAVAGKGTYDCAEFIRVADQKGIPVLATATSGGRGVGSALSGYNHWLVDGVPPEIMPDVVVIAGEVNPGETLHRSFKEISDVVHVDRYGLFSDPNSAMTLGVRGNPAEVLNQFGSPGPEWSARWAKLDDLVFSRVKEWVEQRPVLSGPAVANAMNAIDWRALVVGSSLAIRDVESHVDRKGWIHSNRGLSGIDGFSSTVLGVAESRARTVGMVGDLSFLHDSNAFLTEEMAPAVFVVVDNGGGGLFDLLPQANHAVDYERLFVTPQDRDLAALAAFHRLRFVDAPDVPTLIKSVDHGLVLGDTSVVRVGVERELDLAARSDLERLARELVVEVEF